MYRILICDDEKDIVSALEVYLAAEDTEFIEAFNGKEAVEILKKETVHLVLMDILMPVMDGLNAMLEIRKFSNVPILFLTALSEDMDKIRGLNLGADDYITKPFNPVEVTARVRSQLRRYTLLGAAKNADGVIRLGNIELDTETKEVRVDGEAKGLTRTEFDILKLMMEEPGKVFSSKEIYGKVWDDTPIGAENTVAVHIRHLREKIEIDPAHPRFLKVVWGQGYKIEKGSKL